MITVKQVETDQDFKSCLKIRREVFFREQNVPEELEVDEYEKTSIHFLALFNNTPAGTGRLRIVKEKVKFERISTLKEFRGQGIASKLMETMEAYAKKHYPTLPMTLDAQTLALEFYLKLGWTPVGECFYEANIEHQRMTKSF
ncbi:MAG: GNAT family N-acetyltransferase [Chlamydiia bacterium]|nr:GNAT family N-acetyltransferase [Chlamydiia bacterium]